MLNEILILLVDTAATVYTMVVLMRLFMQLARADFYNPLSQFVVKATDPVLKPLRRVIPGLWGVDLPSLVLAYLVQLLKVALLSTLVVAGFAPWAYLVYALFGVAEAALDLMFFAIIIVIVISWVAPGTYNPTAALLRQITEPVMEPFRRLIPPMGGLDFSPMIALLLIHIVGNIVLPGFQTQLLQ